LIFDNFKQQAHSAQRIQVLWLSLLLILFQHVKDKSRTKLDVRYKVAATGKTGVDNLKRLAFIRQNGFSFQLS